MVCDWKGDTGVVINKWFDQKLKHHEPKWDFQKWIPDIVVICLGMNGHSGLRDSSGEISEEKSKSFRLTYHNFLKILRTVYPNFRIAAVAAYH